MEYGIFHFFSIATFFQAYWNMEYSKKNASQNKNEISGVWNIPGILFQKNRLAKNFLDILQYGISSNIKKKSQPTGA